MSPSWLGAAVAERALRSASARGQQVEGAVVEDVPVLRRGVPQHHLQLDPLRRQGEDRLATIGTIWVLAIAFAIAPWSPRRLVVLVAAFVALQIKLSIGPGANPVRSALVCLAAQAFAAMVLAFATYSVLRNRRSAVVP